MIGRLTGLLAEKSPPQVLIDVNGVGYEVDVPMSSFYKLPGLAERVTLLTHLVVREDAQLLFGFLTAPCVLIEGADLVRQDSPLTDNAQVDRPGTRIMVGKRSAYDLGNATAARGTAVAARCAGDSAWVVSRATACRPTAARRRWWRVATASCRWTQAAAAC